MTSDLRNLVSLIRLDPQRAITIPQGGSSLPKTPLEILPDDFLERAEEDYETGGSAAQLNAITNAKRAVDSQIDEALLRFGYKINSWSFNKKLEAFSNLGLVTPRIIRRIRSPRNKLEHEFKKPKDIEVEEALDLASLFVAATQRHLSCFMDEFTFGNEDEQIDHFRFRRDLTFTMLHSEHKYDKATFTIWAHTNEECKDRINSSMVGETTISCEDKIFPAVVALATATDRGYRVQRAIEQFFYKLGYQNAT